MPKLAKGPRRVSPGLVCSDDLDLAYARDIRVCEYGAREAVRQLASRVKQQREG
jgi:hypothetical protein